MGLLHTPAAPQKSIKHCLCNEETSEYLIHCNWGDQCGGWVHPSCAGMDNLPQTEAEKFRDYVCPFCRSEGVAIPSKKILYSLDTAPLSLKADLIG